MKNITLAICDGEMAYIEKFKTFIMYSNSKSDIHLFTYENLEDFLEAIKECTFDVVLIVEEYVQKIQINKFDKTIFLCLAENLNIKKEGINIPTIFKYQSGEEILRSVFYYYQEVMYEESELQLFQGKKELIAIYSPSHNILRTPLALTFASQYAMEKKVLYINLAECMNFKDWFAEDYRKDIGDLLYFLTANTGNFYGKLKSVIYSMEQFDYIPPFSDPQLLSETKAKDYEYLIESVLGKTDYESIIIDFGIMIPGFFSILKQCTSIYIVQNKDKLEKGCYDYFVEVAKRNEEKIVKQIQKIILPNLEHYTLQESLLREWTWGTLGELVRKVIGIENGDN